MSGHVTESIYSDGRVTIPMADVQHIETHTRGDLHVITKHTTYNAEQDFYNNSIHIADIDDRPNRFKKAWCTYRHELEKDTLKEQQ